MKKRMENNEFKEKVLSNILSLDSNSKKGRKGSLNYSWIEREGRKCIGCGSNFECKNNSSRKYCNKKCSLVSIHKGNIKNSTPDTKLHQCQTCKKDFARPINYCQPAKYCSRSCHCIGNVINSKKKNTNIENIIEKILIDSGIQYLPQQNIKNISIADFKIGKVLIFADGKYWHSLPGRKDKDSEQTKKMLDLGYTVLRFDEDLIINNPEKVKIKIIEYLYEN
jgi:very-short-patch-repair endonuclease